VFFQSEGRGLEAFEIVAAAALRAASPLGELAPVFILMAIHALLEGDRLLEVTFAMASQTIHLLMLSDQGVFGLRVVESLVQCRRGDTLPTACVMAGLATLLCETATMRIAVAVRTLAERQADVTRLVVRARSMALLASHLRMQPGERVSCLGVIELLCRLLPVVVVVALKAIRPEPALVRILMARNTGGSNAEERPV